MGAAELAHGKTPFADATPTVLIANTETGEERSFAAAGVPGSPGLYRAEVVFPTTGARGVAVNDGFPWAECAQTHTFGTHVIAAAASPPPQQGGSGPWPVVGGLLGAVAAAGLVLTAWRARSVKAPREA